MSYDEDALRLELRKNGFSGDAHSLSSEISEVESHLNRFASGWRHLDPIRQLALMLLGFDFRQALWKLVGFRRFVEDEQWDYAARELRNSNWYNRVGERGNRIARMIEFGVVGDTQQQAPERG